MVLGAAVAPAPFGDLRGLAGQLLVNGELIATGSSNDVMSGPREAFAWVARFAQSIGEELRPGQWIMTGSVIPTMFGAIGDTCSFQLGSLPLVIATIR